MTARPMTPGELVAAGGYARLSEIFGPEMVARLVALERDMADLLARELPAADADQRAWWAGQLAHVVATDGPWFSALMQPRPGKVAKALNNVHKAAQALLKALDELPSAAVFGTHMRLLEIDLPGPAARQALSRELVYRTSVKVDAGLNRAKPQLPNSLWPWPRPGTASARPVAASIGRTGWSATRPTHSRT